MRNLLMLLVAVLGTTAMVQAFPAKDGKTAPAKEVKASGKPKAKADKKIKSEKKVMQKETSKKEALKNETPKAKK